MDATLGDQKKQMGALDKTLAAPSLPAGPGASLSGAPPVRAKVAGHTLRRPRAAPNARDALLFPATVVVTVPSVVWVFLGSLWIIRV